MSNTFTGQVAVFQTTCPTQTQIAGERDSRQASGKRHVSNGIDRVVREVQCPAINGCDVIDIHMSHTIAGRGGGSTMGKVGVTAQNVYK
jgi:hypothetical protein